MKLTPSTTDRKDMVGYEEDVRSGYLELEGHVSRLQDLALPVSSGQDKGATVKRNYRSDFTRALFWMCICAFAPNMAFAHGGGSSPSAIPESHGKPDRPNHKSEHAALDHITFLIRDIEKRMKIGDVRGVHAGASEISATADNLWVIGMKKGNTRNLKTINGYMNLLKNSASELNSYGGIEDLENGRERLSKVKSIFGSMREIYIPASVMESGKGKPSDSTFRKAEQVGLDTSVTLPDNASGEKEDSGKKPESPHAH